MTLLIIGTYRVPPENLDAARPAMAAMISASRAEAGCLEYVYAEDVLEPGLIHVTERWANQKSLAAHGRAAHIGAWRATWLALGIGARDLVLYDADGGVAI